MLVVVRKPLTSADAVGVRDGNNVVLVISEQLGQRAAETLRRVALQELSSTSHASAVSITAGAHEFLLN